MSYCHDPYCHHRHYGFFNLLLDLFMISITGGLWLVWIFIRETRRH